MHFGESPTLEQIAMRTYSGDPVTKPLRYYKAYDAFIARHKLVPLNILEIGTYLGESTRVLAEAFPKARVVSIDALDKNLDFSLHPNVTHVVGDQTDVQFLKHVASNLFEGSLDLVIDDASHQGIASSISFYALFEFLEVGGAYFVEDWGTGYWDSWEDGVAYKLPTAYRHRRLSLRRKKSHRSGVSSHDSGMVGFVKSLVDLTHTDAIEEEMELAPGHPKLSSLEFGSGVCMAIKG